MSITAGEEILIVDELLNITGTSQSFDSTTGALVITFGGVGMGENLNIGQNFTTSDLTINQILTLGTGTTSYSLPTEKGADNEVLIFTTANGLVFGSIEEPNQVTTLSFGVNNALMKSLGTEKEIEATGIIITGTNNISGINNLTVDNFSTLGGTVKIASSSSSTSITTGALLVTGGVGITENLNIGNNLNVSGTTNINGLLNISGGTSGYVFPAEAGNTGQILIISTAGTIIFEDEIISANLVTAPSTFGSDNLMLKTSGVDRAIEATGITITDSNDITGIKDLTVINETTVGGIFRVSGTQSSTDTTTGALLVTGGVGVVNNVNVANNLNIIGTFTVNNLFTLGGISPYVFPTNIGEENQILSVSTSGSELVFITPIIHPNRVESTSSFGTDNVLIKSDGTSRSVEATGILLSDIEGLSGINTLNVVSNTTIGGTLVLTSTEPSINSSTGALVVQGGIGISEDLNVNGNINTTNPVTINNTVQSTSSTTGSLIIAGGAGITGDININGTLEVDNLILGNSDINITSTTTSTDNTTGAVVVQGGVGIEDGLNIGGYLNVDSTLIVNGITTFSDTIQSNSNTDGALILSGGVGIAKNLNVGGTMNVNNTTESTTSLNGAMIIDGGVGVAKNVNVGGNFTIDQPVLLSNSANSTSNTNGALIISGGVSVDRDVYANGLFLSNPLSITNKFFMAYHTVTTSVDSTTSAALQWNTEIRKDSLYTHATNSTDVVITESGWYEIEADVTTQIEAGDGNNRSILNTRITINGTPITQTDSFIMNRTASAGYGNTNIIIIQNLTANDIVNVDINRASGTSTLTSVANACRLSIARI